MVENPDLRGKEAGRFMGWLADIIFKTQAHCERRCDQSPTIALLNRRAYDLFRLGFDPNVYGWANTDSRPYEYFGVSIHPADQEELVRLLVDVPLQGSRFQEEGESE